MGPVFTLEAVDRPSPGIRLTLGRRAQFNTRALDTEVSRTRGRHRRPNWRELSGAVDCRLDGGRTRVLAAAAPFAARNAASNAKIGAEEPWPRH